MQPIFFGANNVSWVSVGIALPFGGFLRGGAKDSRFDLVGIVLGMNWFLFLKLSRNNVFVRPKRKLGRHWVRAGIAAGPKIPKFPSCAPLPPIPKPQYTNSARSPKPFSPQCGRRNTSPTILSPSTAFILLSLPCAFFFLFLSGWLPD
jgi:hypothetical protein